MSQISMILCYNNIHDHFSFLLFILCFISFRLCIVPSNVSMFSYLIFAIYDIRLPQKASLYHYTYLKEVTVVHFNQFDYLVWSQSLLGANTDHFFVQLKKIQKKAKLNNKTRIQNQGIIHCIWNLNLESKLESKLE